MYGLGKTEINQVDSVCVFVTEQNVLCLDIVVQKVHLVKLSDALYLKSKRVKLSRVKNQYRSQQKRLDKNLMVVS